MHQTLHHSQLKTQNALPDPCPLTPDPSLTTPDPSAKRLAANRRNALKSTGPTSPEGKSRSSLNALTHGLRSQSPALLPSEDPHLHQLFHDQMLAELNPQSPLALTLALQIIHLSWQLQRIPQTESDLFHKHAQYLHAQAQEAHKTELGRYQYKSNTYRKAHPAPEFHAPRPPTPAQTLSYFFRHYDDKSNPFTRLQRYETTLHRNLFRCLKQYQQLQPLPNPEPPPADHEPPATDELPNEPTDHQTPDHRNPPATDHGQLTTDHGQLTTDELPNEPTTPSPICVHLCESVVTNESPAFDAPAPHATLLPPDPVLSPHSGDKP